MYYITNVKSLQVLTGVDGTFYTDQWLRQQIELNAYYENRPKHVCVDDQVNTNGGKKRWKFQSPKNCKRQVVGYCEWHPTTNWVTSRIVIILLFGLVSVKIITKITLLESKIDIHFIKLLADSADVVLPVDAWLIIFIK